MKLINRLLAVTLAATIAASPCLGMNNQVGFINNTTNFITPWSNNISLIPTNNWQKNLIQKKKFAIGMPTNSTKNSNTSPSLATINETITSNKSLQSLLKLTGISVKTASQLSISQEEIATFIQTTLGGALDFEGYANKQAEPNTCSSLYVSTFCHWVSSWFSTNQPSLIEKISSFINEANSENNNVVLSIASTKQTLTSPTVKDVLKAIGTTLKNQKKSDQSMQSCSPIILQANPVQQNKLDKNAKHAINLVTRHTSKVFCQPIDLDVAYNQDAETITIIGAKQHKSVCTKNQNFIKKIKNTKKLIKTKKCSITNSKEIEKKTTKEQTNNSDHEMLKKLIQIKNLDGIDENTIKLTNPNIEDLEIDLSASNLQDDLKIPFIMSLASQKWNLSKISIDLGSYKLCEKEFIQIFDALTKISSLQSITILPNHNFSLIGNVALQYIAQHPFITKPHHSLRLTFDSDFINELEYNCNNLEYSKIEKLLQENMHADTKITLNNRIITKNKVKIDEQIKHISDSEIQEARNQYTKKYSIHLMWINRNKENSFAVYKKYEKSKQIIKTALAWAKQNPEAKIYIWHDKNFIENSKAVVQNMETATNTNTKEKQIFFNDINELKLVKEHSSVFSDKLPVYFRVDLIREIIAYEMLTKNEISCFIYSDIDMTPITKEQLFDDETISLLKKYGFVMARKGIMSPYENGFQMTINHPTAMKAIKDILIDINIATAESFINPPTLKSGDETIDCNEEKNDASDFYWASFTQQVYNTFSVMFRYIHFLNGVAQTTKEINNKKILEKACLYFWGRRLYKVERLLSNIKLKNGFSWFYPTKKVKLPSAGCNYY